MLSLALTQELISPRGLEREFSQPRDESWVMFVKIHSKKKTGWGPGESHAHAPEERARLKQSLLRNTINTKKKWNGAFIMRSHWWALIHSARTSNLRRLSHDGEAKGPAGYSSKKNSRAVISSNQPQIKYIKSKHKNNQCQPSLPCPRVINP